MAVYANAGWAAGAGKSSVGEIGVMYVETGRPGTLQVFSDRCEGECKCKCR